MSLQWKMLIWKEWTERRGQFLICLSWMLLATAYCISYEATHHLRTPLAYFFGAASLFGLAAPIFLAMRTSVGEIANGTRSFSESLPISKWRQGGVRLMGGAVMLIAPILVSAILMWISLASGGTQQVPARASDHTGGSQMDQRSSLTAMESLELTGRVTAVVAVSSLFLYILLCLLNTRCRSESTAGFLGAGAAFLLTFASALEEILKSSGMEWPAHWTGSLLPASLLLSFGYGTDQGHYGDLFFPHPVTERLLVNVLLQGLLAIWFVGRYGSQRRKRRSEAISIVPQSHSPLPRPFATTWGALTWLSLRNSLPMTLTGLLIAALVGPLMNSGTISRLQTEFSGAAADSLSHSMWIVGWLWSVVVGAGIFSSEVDRRVGEFWRTRPIPPRQLFVLKFGIGLCVVLLVLDGSAIAAGALFSSRWGSYEAMNWPYVACFVPLHATMYVIAVAWTCFLRQPALGGLAALISNILLTLLQDTFSVFSRYDILNVYHGFLFDAVMNSNYFGMLLSMLVTSSVATLIAYRAFRRGQFYLRKI